LIKFIKEEEEEKELTKSNFKIMLIENAIFEHPKSFNLTISERIKQICPVALVKITLLFRQN